MRKIAFAAGALAAALPSLPAFAATEAETVRQIVQKHVDAGEIAGAVVLAEHNGKITVQEAIGNSALKNGVPLKTDSVIWVASMTKPIVAVAALILVDQGKLNLEDPISKYIPEFHDTKVRTLKPGFSYGANGRPDPNGPKPEYDVAPANRPLKVRDFITFTSGLQVIAVPNDTLPPIGPNDDLGSWVPRLGATTLEYQPGTRWSYSNATGYEVLARVVEVAAGMPFGEFCQRMIFDPLGMKSTHFGPRADLKDRTLPMGGLANAPIMNGKFSSGSAGILTSAPDYARFATMLLNGGTLDGHRILKAATVKAMSSNQIGNIGIAGIDPVDYGGLQNKVKPGIKYGFGVALVTDHAAAGLAVPDGSFGWDGVGTRRWWAMPAKKTVLIMLVPEAAPAPAPGAAVTHREVEAAVVAAAR